MFNYLHLPSGTHTTLGHNVVCEASVQQSEHVFKLLNV